MTSRINDLDRAIGRTLRDARLEAGKSQPQLAEALGISFQQVAKYENGANRITASRLVGFAAALGTTAADLLARAESDPQPDRQPKRQRALLELTRAAATLDTGVISALGAVAREIRRGGGQG